MILFAMGAPAFGQDLSPAALATALTKAQEYQQSGCTGTPEERKACRDEIYNRAKKDKEEADCLAARKSKNDAISNFLSACKAKGAISSLSSGSSSKLKSTKVDPTERSVSECSKIMDTCQESFDDELDISVGDEPGELDGGTDPICVDMTKSDLNTEKREAKRDSDAAEKEVREAKKKILDDQKACKKEAKELQEAMQELLDEKNDADSKAKTEAREAEAEKKRSLAELDAAMRKAQTDGVALIQKKTELQRQKINTMAMYRGELIKCQVELDEQQAKMRSTMSHMVGNVSKSQAQDSNMKKRLTEIWQTCAQKALDQRVTYQEGLTGQIAFIDQQIADTDAAVKAAQQQRDDMIRMAADAENQRQNDQYMKISSYAQKYKAMMDQKSQADQACQQETMSNVEDYNAAKSKATRASNDLATLSKTRIRGGKQTFSDVQELSEKKDAAVKYYDELNCSPSKSQSMGSSSTSSGAK